ncbi:hypothetical protein ACFX2I_033619 [Malus domestica]
MSTNQSNSCNNILGVTSKPTTEKGREQVETADQHVMDVTVADPDFKEQVKVAVDEKVHVVENEQVVLNNEQVDDLAEQIEMMKEDEQANEKPIISENQENLIGGGGFDDDEQDSAAMLLQPHDQQPVVEEPQPQEAFEIGVGAGSSPVTPGFYEIPSLSTDSALARPWSPFSSTAVDYAPAAKDSMKYTVNSEQILMGHILGNNQQSSVPLPSGIQQSFHQHFQQMPIFQQNMASEDSRSNRMFFPIDDQVPLRSFETGIASGYTNATNNIPVAQLDNGNGGSPYMRAQAIASLSSQQPMQLHQPATLSGSPEIQFHGLMANQSTAASNGSLPSAGYQNIVIQQAMPSSFTSVNAYDQLAGEFQRPAAMIPTNNWQGSMNFPVPNYSNSAPAPPPRAIKNSLYDPKYEAMGLPIDPHLRMFLAQQRRENGGYSH